MRIVISLILTIFFTLSVSAGSIYESNSRLGAIKVYLVKSRIQADLCVYVSKSRIEANGKDEVWYYVNSKSSSDASIYFVSSQLQADIKVYIVSSKIQAGWRNSNQYRGQFK